MKSAAIDVKTFSEARANLKSVMDQVVADGVPVVISRRKAEAVVMISLAEWNAWQETMYLNSTAANRQALDEAISELDAGGCVRTTIDANGRPEIAKRDDAA